MSRDAAAHLSVPSGHQVRRWTRRQSRARSDAGLAELLTDVYTAVFVLAVTVSMVLSGANQFGADLGTAPPTAREGISLAPGWVAVLVALATLAAGIGLAARLGPVSVTEAEATWWLPLAVDRRSLLRLGALRWPAVALAAGAGLGIALALAIGAGGDAARVTGAAGVGAAAATTAVVGLGLAQARPATHRRVMLGADLTLGLVPVLGVGLAVGAPAAPAVPSALGWLALGWLVLVALLVWALDRALPRLRDASLRERGEVTSDALGAVLMLDTRALGRALSEQGRGRARRRSSALPTLARAPRRWRPALALPTSDALLLLRTPRHLVQLAAAACLPVLAVLISRPVPAVVVVAMVVGSHLAALAATDGARRAAATSVLDRLLPLSASWVRRLRLVTPTAVLELWALAVLGVIGWRYGDVGGWLALGALAAPVWAAAALRAAYRPLPDFTGPVVATPMGAVPTGAAAVVLRGPDVALIGAVPVLVALFLGEVPPVLLAVQAVLAVIAAAVATYVPREP